MGYIHIIYMTIIFLKQLATPLSNCVFTTSCYPDLAVSLQLLHTHGRVHGGKVGNKDDQCARIQTAI